jgi:DNA-binding protein HU-beta
VPEPFTGWPTVPKTSPKSAKDPGDKCFGTPSVSGVANFQQQNKALGPFPFGLESYFPLQERNFAPERLFKMPVSKSKASTKPGKPVTIKHLAATLAEEHQLTKRGGEALMHNLVSLITKHLKKGERIRIAGLGILQVRKRAARMGRNPATGEAIKIKASKKVAFRAAKDLKEAV